MGFNVADLAEVGGLRMMLPVEIDPEQLDEWLNDNADHARQLLEQNGALLIRQLPAHGSKKLEKVMSKLFDDSLLEYNFRSTPRTKMRGRIYTSSEYHADETILLHNENAYCNEWAMKIGFYCVKASEVGGATPIGDSRKIYRDIPADIRDRFERKGLLYVRNYGDIDLPWTEVFQTTDRSEVEQYCHNSDIEFQWIGQNGLRTKQRAGVSYLHPRSGEAVWFNQAHLFHISSMPEQHRHSLLDTFKTEDLPRNVYFADGEEIDDQSLDIIRQVYRRHEVAFQWQDGDLLLLDNMLFAHGRHPFSGNRRILVGMATPMSSQAPELKAVVSAV
ncbi:hypothetical protein A5320_18200 [Rheinheimera sp. SA_1]|nr:hypothetical protein A5320_18200 [Rheinheimera sp. SA_1]